MFPAPAGMSPSARLKNVDLRYVPRTRGDEPPKRLKVIYIFNMFPAPAGMSPTIDPLKKVLDYVPRTRGDEPGVKPFYVAGQACSPHPRG